MSKIRRNFTPEDRYSIVQEAIRDGHADVQFIPFVAAQVAIEVSE